MVGGGVPPGARQLEQLGDRRRRLDHFGLRRPSPPHRDDDDLPLAREPSRDVSCHGRLPHALAGSDHRDRRQRKRLEDRRVEPEVGPDVWEPLREDVARQPEPLRRAHHRLVGQIDDDVCAAEVLDDRGTVVLAAAELLRPAGHPDARHLVRKRGERVTHDRGVVLAVDHDDGTGHRRAVTSPSIRAVYFSNSSVSTRNWMIFSWPWNGYFRHAATCEPVYSITL